MKKVKSLLCMLLCVCLALFAAGCGNLFREEEDIDESMKEVLAGVDFDADENYSGELFIGINSEPDQVILLETLIEGFSAKYKNIKVTYKNYPSASYSSVLTSMNSSANINGNYSDLPDMFWTSQDSLPAYHDIDMLMPIDYFAKNDKSFTFDDLFGLMVDECTIGSHVYMMPRDCDRVAMYYNKDYVDRLGVTIPSDRALTKTEFLELLSKCTSLTTTDASGNNVGVYALDAFFSWESLLWPLVYGYGGSVVSVDENGETVASLNNSGTAAAYEFIKRLNILGYIPALGSTSNGNLFKRGQAVLHFGSRAALSSITGIKNLQVAPMPNLAGDEFDNYYVGTGCSGYAMYRHTSHPTEAWLFQKYLVSEEGQNSISATGNNIPVLAKLYTDTNAVWRNYKVNDVADFNHSAFVYDYQKSSITAQVGYKTLISPISAISSISTYFKESVVAAVNYTTQNNYLDEKKGIPYYLSLYNKSINSAIALAKES